jgi:hypothetical protein
VGARTRPRETQQRPHGLGRRKSSIMPRRWPPKCGADRTVAMPTRKSAKPGAGCSGSSRGRSSVPMALAYPDRCNRLDYQGEIAIVLGKPAAI